MTIEDFAKLNPKQQNTLILAMHLRNELEDFHVAHLDDHQMKELNQLSRQAIYEGLGFMERIKKKDKEAIDTIAWLIKMIPEYWEIPGTPKPKR